MGENEAFANAIGVLSDAAQGERFKAAVGGRGSLAESVCTRAANELDLAISLLRSAAMKSIGNLAVICGRRKDVLLQISSGKVTLVVGEEPDRVSVQSDWGDDAQIEQLIQELNFGKYAEK